MPIVPTLPGYSAVNSLYRSRWHYGNVSHIRATRGTATAAAWGPPIPIPVEPLLLAINKATPCFGAECYKGLCRCCCPPGQRCRVTDDCCVCEDGKKSNDSPAQVQSSTG